MKNELYRGQITRHGVWPIVSVVLTREVNVIVGWLITQPVAEETSAECQWRMHFAIRERDEAVEWAVDYVNQERLAALEREESEA